MGRAIVFLFTLTLSIKRENEINLNFFTSLFALKTRQIIPKETKQTEQAKNNNCLSFTRLEVTIPMAPSQKRSTILSSPHRPIKSDHLSFFSLSKLILAKSPALTGATRFIASPKTTVLVQEKRFFW